MKTKRGRITAAELSAKLQADPEFMARQKERDRLLKERVAKHHAEQAPLLAELRAVGLEIQAVSDLIAMSTRYERAIPILLKHLLFSYSDVTQETIARSLAVPVARYAWPIFVSEYCKTPTLKKCSGRKDGLAVALAATATEAVMEELVALAKDKSHGDSRLLLLRALRKSKSPITKQALEELAADPALAKEIASWKR